MKKNIVIIIVSAFIGGLCSSSCSDILDEDAKAIAVETFYRTSSDCDAAVNSVINRLRSAYYRDYIAMIEAYSDLAYGRGTYAHNSLYQGENATDINRTDGLWSTFYQAIRDCNIPISHIPDADRLTDSEKDRYMGELRFLRAYAYYQIVRNWGSAPLRTELNVEEWNLGKSSVEDIYNYIVEDLKYASYNAPETSRVIGTPNKYAAKSLLSEVYLILKDYFAAKQCAGDVIQSGRYSLVPVSKTRDFDKIFGADVSESTEEIFYRKTSRTDNDGWEYVMFVSHPNAFIDGLKMHGAGGYYGMYTLVDNPSIASWDEADLRKKLNILPFDYGEGDNTALLCKYYDPNAANKNGANVNTPWIRYTDVLLVYAEAVAKADGVSSDAMEKLNMIHRRAYGYSPTTLSPVDYKLEDYSTLERFMDLLILEQGYETFNEGKRWYFLKRLNIAKSKVKSVKGLDVLDKHMLWMIPEQEFNTNKALDWDRDQNPGY